MIDTARYPKSLHMQANHEYTPEILSRAERALAINLINKSYDKQVYMTKLSSVIRKIA